MVTWGPELVFPKYTDINKTGQQTRKRFDVDYSYKVICGAYCYTDVGH
jgi:hypothetical protein